MTDAMNTTTAWAEVQAVVLSGITKRFPGVVANDGVNFAAAHGEVHALLGENGAGKSTLSNVLTGLYRPDEGTIDIGRVRHNFGSPRDALDAGVGMVHQHFRLVQTFSVAENVVLGEKGGGVFLSRRIIEQRVRELSERYHLPVDPAAKIWQLSVGEQQRVEILKVLYRQATVLILDEPTAVLTPAESQALFTTMRAIVAEGRTVIFISHKLDEVIDVADRVTVLRGGRSVGTVATSDSTVRSLAELMVGRDIAFTRQRSNDLVFGDSPVVLEMRHLQAHDDRGRMALKNVSLTVRAGEIVGVAGVAGNGQRELAEVITGLRESSGGVTLVGGFGLRGGNPREAIDAGLAHVPEDRLHTGLAPSLSVEDNLVLKSYRKRPIHTVGVLRRSRIRSMATALIERFDVKTPGPQTATRLLSGGNVQKVLLAREFTAKPKVMVAASPTRGLDVGAIETVRKLILQAADDGVGVLLISEDLEEVLALTDRLVVMYEGAIVGEFATSAASIESIGMLMGGASASPDEVAAS